MEKYFEFSISDHREMNKIALDTFCFGKENILDNPVDRLITSLDSRIKKFAGGLKEVENQMDLKKPSTDTDHQELEMKRISFIQDIYYLENELHALYEIKIIYAFKHLETNIKKLLSAAYNDKGVNKQFTWEKLITYLRSKNIDQNHLENYLPVNELRLVNNVIKHSGNLNDQSLNGIPEFKEVEDKSPYRVLQEFYDRVKSAPLKFLEDLSGKVYADLYEYSQGRIDEMARSIALRMNREDAMKFTNEIAKHYK